MRRGEIHELIRELDKYAVRYEFDDWHVRLFGGNNQARWHYEDVIASNAEIEAMLILQLSKRDPDLRYIIEERASIRWADAGKPYDLLEAVKVHMEVAREDEARREIQVCGEMSL